MDGLAFQEQPPIVLEQRQGDMAVAETVKYFDDELQIYLDAVLPIDFLSILDIQSVDIEVNVG